MDTKVLTEKELATELGLSPWTVRKMRLQDGLPHIKSGHRFLYRLSTVNAWFEQQEKKSIRQAEPEGISYGKLRKITS